jgi:uncharacterized protein YcbK (DUF882 family)
MQSNIGSKLTRRTLLGAFSGIAMVSAAPTYAGLPAFLRGAGDIRRIKMRSGRTGEMVDTVYWADGEYIEPALAELNYFMRDWREDAVTRIDIRNIDILAAAHHLMETEEPYQLLSGYRTARTNAYLRSRSRKVAKDSYHIKGKAADVRLSSRSVNQMARAAASINVGGVGRYSRSNFVHMDCGPIRTWGA